MPPSPDFILFSFFCKRARGDFKTNLVPFGSHSPIPLPALSNHESTFCLEVHLFWTFHVNEIKQHAVFWDVAPLGWLNSRRCMDIAARISAVGTAERYPWHRQTPFVHPPALTAAYLSGFHLDARMKNVAVHSRLQRGIAK